MQGRTGSTGKEDSSSHHYHRSPTTIKLQVRIEHFQSCSRSCHFCSRLLLPDTKEQVTPYSVVQSPVCRLHFCAVAYGNSRVSYGQQHRPTFFLTETWLKQQGDEGRCAKLTPAGCSMRSFYRPSRGGSLAVIFCDSLPHHVSSTSSVSFTHSSLEAVHVTEVSSFLLHLQSSSRPKNKQTNKKSRLTNCS